MARGKKRAEPETEPETEQTKKLRSVCKAVDDGAAELLCPITQELPLDPVIAEDGRVYDRSAIEQWLSTNEKSPHTNEPMGKKLIPALQVKNVISGLVRSGALSSDKCEAWTKRLEQEKMVEDMRAKADAGDVEAMMTLYRWYDRGDNGLAENESMSIYWCKRAADLDDPDALLELAYYYLYGACGETDRIQGAVKLTQAAMLGNTHAIYKLVRQYHFGEEGFKESASAALYWAKKFQAIPETADKREWMSGPAGNLLKTVLEFDEF